VIALRYFCGMPREIVFRFGIGAPDRPRSSVWRLWMQQGKSDVYLANSATAYRFHISFHASGQCHERFTHQFVESERAAGRWSGGNGIQARWQKPEYALDGGDTSILYSLLFPTSELRPEPLDARTAAASVTWLTPAREGWSRELWFGLARPGLGVLNVYDQAEHSPEPLLSWALPNGESLFLYGRSIPTPSHLGAEVARKEAELAPHRRIAPGPHVRREQYRFRREPYGRGMCETALPPTV
jgi:hypothetical protein